MLILTQIFGKTAWQSATSVRVSMASSRPTSLNLWPGTIPMEYPSRVTFEQIQADPSLPERDASVLAEFQAAPWLLPPRTKALSYAGMHQLDMLAEHRSMPIGNLTKAITFLTFNAKFAVMTQNCIYSMVKFGGVRNYIVGTWDPDDLQACMDLNLPCADVTSFLPEPMDKAPGAGLFRTHDYLVICWLRPAVLVHLLQQGYAVHSTDSDIVYLMKPVWASFLAYMEQGHADAAFQTEYPVNGGNYVMLPTAASIAFATAWAAMAPAMIKEHRHDQDAFSLVDSAKWRLCSDSRSCHGERAGIFQRNASGTQMLIRRFSPNHFNYWAHVCSLTIANPFPKIDPCDWAVMFLHPVCSPYEIKVNTLKHQGFWFVDDESCTPQNNTASHVTAFNVTDKTDCWVGALPVGEMVSGWPRASRRAHQARDRGQAAASKVGSSPAEVKLPASTRAWTRQERPPQAAANSTASADLCAAGASVPPLSHSSADELAHHMSVGVAVWRASAPRTPQQGQA
ncbi:hypothetical protein D9Q98_003930 [Chlorella vulgaris]|uniref:Nucleotide-diphospho-sugar transferase domain-containing protein n=1 Tax=Chlorella vulgaris TaxID=3077 RepID=A0A9D4TQR2_CHLVU|nr:hypothetical protein D9Q98_003930 [Chlorella vulgaris]